VITRNLSFVFIVFASWTAVTCGAADPIDVGSRLELFVDDYLIDSFSGAELTLHHPTAREVALVFVLPFA